MANTPTRGTPTALAIPRAHLQPLPSQYIPRAYLQPLPSLLQRHISALHTANEAWDTRLWLALCPGDTMGEQVIGCMADVLLKRWGSNELDGPPSASLAVAGTGKLAENAPARSHPAASGAEEPAPAAPSCLAGKGDPSWQEGGCSSSLFARATPHQHSQHLCPRFTRFLSLRLAKRSSCTNNV